MSSVVDDAVGLHIRKNDCGYSLPWTSVGIFICKVIHYHGEMMKVDSFLMEKVGKDWVYEVLKASTLLLHCASSFFFIAIFGSDDLVPQHRSVVLLQACFVSILYLVVSTPCSRSLSTSSVLHHLIFLWYLVIASGYHH
ncbi:hypothetical protein MKX03_022106 [Papaver bracteatum]|nr:hypothetical protein MKX03_022106 [Papaver bracteatum]